MCVCIYIYIYIYIYDVTQSTIWANVKFFMCVHTVV